jgi:hypothetical protein
VSEPRDDEPPDGGLFDDLGVSDEEMDQWLAEWDEADRGAVDLLRRALADQVGRPAPASLAAAASDARAGLTKRGSPLQWVRKAAELDPRRLPDDDAELLIRATAGTIVPQEITGLPDEEEATLVSLEHGDWAGAVISAVRGGAGADASPSSLVDGYRRCPEIEFADELEDDDASFLETAFWIVALPWRALGLIDGDHRLTPVGGWILPRALARAWNGEFDQPPADEQ